MHTNSRVLAALLFAAAALPVLTFAQQASGTPGLAAHPGKQQAVQQPAMPFFFEPHGDAFLARGAHYDLQVNSGGAQISLSGPEPALVEIAPREANPAARAEAEGRLPGTSNYYIGKDPEGWVTGVPQFRRIRYREVYEGIDLVYYGAGHQLEFDFVVAPGADPNSIGLSFYGASSVDLDANGDLVLKTHSGELRQRKPVAYQEGPEGRTLVAAAYQLDDAGASFELATYDVTRPLIIDPILDYSTFVGGNGNDWTGGIDFDPADGSIYVCGLNDSTMLPVGSQLSPVGGNGWVAFILKLSPDAKTVQYLTHIGNLGGADYTACRHQPDGFAVMAGEAEGDIIPQINPIQNGYGGGDSDVFVARFNPSGQVVFSSYLGGNDYEGPLDIEVDAAGNFYVGGWTASTNFPRQAPFQNLYGGGDEDGFLTKYSANGGAMLYSTMFGGNGWDYIGGIAVDSAGSMYATGYTESTNLQTPVTAFQRNYAGNGDVFALKLNQAGDTQTYFTFLGGSGEDWSEAADVDSEGNLYIAGVTDSNDFPVLSIQGARAGGEDSFLTKLNFAGTELVHSTYLGGAQDDRALGVEVNSFNEAYVTGWTESVDFPVVKPTQDRKHIGEDGFLYKMNAAGDALIYSTFIGGPSDDVPWTLAIDRIGGMVALVGYTEGNGYPTVNPVQGYGGAEDGILSIFVEAVGTNAASYERGQLTPASIGAVFGNYFVDAFELAPAGTQPTTLQGARVTITDSMSASRDSILFFVTPGPPSQINFYVDPATALGPAVLSVTTADGTVFRGAIEIVALAPGLFSQNSSGAGVAAANVATYTNGVATYTLAARFEGGVFVHEPIDLGPPGVEVYVFLYGTGMRAGSITSATINGVPVTVFGPVDQGEFIGLDQINVGPIPRSLIGAGVVEIQFIMDGIVVNTLTVEISS